MLKILKKYGKSKPTTLIRNARYRSRFAKRTAIAASAIACGIVQCEIIKYSKAHPLEKMMAICQHQIQTMKASSAAMNFGRRKVDIKLLEKQHDATKSK